MNDITTISLTKKTKDELDRFGKFGDSYEDIVNRLVKIAGATAK